MVDYCKLGHTEATKTRRFKVIGLLAKGATPMEIYKSINKEHRKKEIKEICLETIYKDIKEINKLYAKGDDTTLMAVQAQGATFYQHKIRELEAYAQTVKDDNPSVYLGVQKLLADMKEKDLKLKGAFIEKVEHIGGQTIEILMWRPEISVEPEKKEKKVESKTEKIES